ncbi:TolB family protein, partial [Gemmatimonas sp.]|uniref:TolB family protein n=1 Tax=Gemmatimonas sp. TaxID=1962908 RepID=UPI00391D363F
MPRTPLFRVAAAALSAAALSACSSTTPAGAPSARPLRRAIASDTGEAHLANLLQLTDGGENAEAYFSADGRYITFQSTRDGRSCDQQYVMRADGSQLTKVSRGGKTTCGWFLPGSKQVFFGATHHAD